MAAFAGLSDTSMADIQFATEETPLVATNADAAALDSVAQSAAQDPAGTISSESLDSAAVEKAAFGPQEQVAEEQPSEEVAKPKQLSKSQMRIMQLVQERNRAREEATVERQRYAQEMRQAREELARQNGEFQRRQLELEQRRTDLEEARARQQEEASLSDVERARRNFLKDARSEAKQEMSPELASLRSEVSKLREFQTQLVQQHEQKQRFDQIDAMGKAVLDKELLNRYDSEDASGLREDMEEMLHAMAGAYKMYPNQIAPKFKQFIQKVVRAENKALSKTAGQKIAQSQQVPQSLPTGRGTSGAGGIDWPEYNALRANGYDSHIEWLRAGRPQLKKKVG